MPDKGFNNQAAIEGQTWQQIEQTQHQVQAAQLGDHVAEHRGDVGGIVNIGHQGEAKHQAHRRARRRDPQGSHGRAGFPLNAGHATQEKQGDAAHLDPLGHGHKGMAKLMQEHGNKQQQRRDKSQAPLPDHGDCNLGVEAVVLGKSTGGQQQNHEPAGMDLEGDPANLEDLPAVIHA